MVAVGGAGAAPGDFMTLGSVPPGASARAARLVHAARRDPLGWFTPLRRAPFWAAFYAFLRPEGRPLPLTLFEYF